MKSRTIRLSGAVVAIGLVVGGIAISMPVASSAAPAKPAVYRGNAPKFTFTQLAAGLFFSVGPVGKLAFGNEAAATMTTDESKIVKAFATALGTSSTSGATAVAAELQSGSVSEFTQAIAAINAQDSVLGSTSGLSASSAASTVQERTNVARARESLGRSGEMGSTCSSTVAAGATTCAQNPAVVSPNGADLVHVNVVVQVTAVVIIAQVLVLFGTVKANSSDTKLAKVEITKLTKALAA